MLRDGRHCVGHTPLLPALPPPGCLARVRVPHPLLCSFRGCGKLWRCWWRVRQMVAMPWGWRIGRIGGGERIAVRPVFLGVPWLLFLARSDFWAGPFCPLSPCFLAGVRIWRGELWENRVRLWVLAWLACTSGPLVAQEVPALVAGQAPRPGQAAQAEVAPSGVPVLADSRIARPAFAPNALSSPPGPGPLKAGASGVRPAAHVVPGLSVASAIEVAPAGVAPVIKGYAPQVSGARGPTASDAHRVRLAYSARIPVGAGSEVPAWSTSIAPSGAKGLVPARALGVAAAVVEGRLAEGGIPRRPDLAPAGTHADAEALRALSAAGTYAGLSAGHLPLPAAQPGPTPHASVSAAYDGRPALPVVPQGGQPRAAQAQHGREIPEGVAPGVSAGRGVALRGGQRVSSRLDRAGAPPVAARPSLAFSQQGHAPQGADGVEPRAALGAAADLALPVPAVLVLGAEVEGAAGLRPGTRSGQIPQSSGAVALAESARAAQPRLAEAVFSRTYEGRGQFFAAPALGAFSGVVGMVPTPAPVQPGATTGGLLPVRSAHVSEARVLENTSIMAGESTPKGVDYAAGVAARPAQSLPVQEALPVVAASPPPSPVYGWSADLSARKTLLTAP